MWKVIKRVECRAVVEQYRVGRRKIRITGTAWWSGEVVEAIEEEKKAYGD